MMIADFCESDVVGLFLYFFLVHYGPDWLHGSPWQSHSSPIPFHF